MKIRMAIKWYLGYKGRPGPFWIVSVSYESKCLICIKCLFVPVIATKYTMICIFLSFVKDRCFRCYCSGGDYSFKTEVNCWVLRLCFGLLSSCLHVQWQAEHADWRKDTVAQLRSPWKPGGVEIPYQPSMCACLLDFVAEPEFISA